MRDALVEYLALREEFSTIDVGGLLEVPQRREFGDYALPLFSLAKERKMAPASIATQFASLQYAEFIVKVVPMGPYLNFFLDAQWFVEHALKWRMPQIEQRSYIIEYAQPNTNKPLHIGHSRNMLLGRSLVEVLKRAGHTVHPVTLFNDRGIAICKSMLCYMRYGEGRTPESEGIKPDHFVGKYYRMFEERSEQDPSLIDDAQELLRRWEAGDAQVREVWARMNAWAIEGFRQTYAHYDLSFEKEYYESDIYSMGVELVKEHRGEIFEVDEDGATIYTREDESKYTLLRKDETALYITQDIALAKVKKEDFDADRSVYVVAHDQGYHFTVLFEVIDRLGFSHSSEHFAYGLVTLPEGKMSSRKGNVVGADDLLDRLIARAGEVLDEKQPDLNLAERERRAYVIARAALAYYMLKFNPLSDIVFDEEQALSFDGETGPYILYTCARIKSLLKKGSANREGSFDEEDKPLAARIAQYPAVLVEAAEKHRPSMIAHYALALAQSFNEYYHAYKVIGDSREGARLLLAEHVAKILEEALGLLGIDTLEEM